jgi:hypothetical protein
LAGVCFQFIQLALSHHRILSSIRSRESCSGTVFSIACIYSTAHRGQSAALTVRIELSRLDGGNFELLLFHTRNMQRTLRITQYRVNSVPVLEGP